MLFRSSTVMVSVIGWLMKRISEDRCALAVRLGTARRLPLLLPSGKTLVRLLHEFGLALDDGRKFGKPRRYRRKGGSDEGERSLTLRKR